MNKPVLVIIAGGMGSRYGGLKQIEPVDKTGHWIIDFSMYDAKRAGFETVICVVAPDMESDFRETVGKRAGRHMDIQYACQFPDDIPGGFSFPRGRVKPWGTAHAVYSARRLVNGPFAVVNADDFYGADAYRQVCDFLRGYEKGRHAMVGYLLENTLTEHGTVSRGVCEIGGNDLVSVVERTRIKKVPGGAAFTEDGENYVFLSGETLVSMNLWGFGPEIMDDIERDFITMLETNLAKNPLLCEHFLPAVPNALLTEKKARVTVLRTAEKWLGVTYKNDMPFVREEITKLKASGAYPERLWA